MTDEGLAVCQADGCERDAKFVRLEGSQKPHLSDASLKVCRRHQTSEIDW